MPQEDLMNDRTSKVMLACILLIIGVSVFCFFYIAHPIILLSGDDWVYASYFRRGAFPNPFSWNAIKVLPEEIAALMGTISAFIVYPLRGDYIRSLSLTCAIVISVFIVLYAFRFYRLMRRKFKFPLFISSLNMCLFIILHFVILRGKDSGCEHLFYADSFNGVSTYLLPLIINASIVFYLMEGNNIEDLLSQNWTMTHKAVIYFCIYFAIFSNIYHSIIFASYIFSGFMNNMIKMLKEGKAITAILRNNLAKIIVLSVWAFSIILEAFGGRARTAYSARLFSIDSIWKSVQFFLYRLEWVNIFFLCLLVIAAAAAIVFVLINWTVRLGIKAVNATDIARSSKPFLSICGGVETDIFVENIFPLLLCTTFDILVNAVVNPSYSYRTCCISAIFFYLLLFVLYMISIIEKNAKWVNVFLPIAVMVFFFEGMFGYQSSIYRENNVCDFDPEKGYKIDSYIIERVTWADDMGFKSITINIPEYILQGERYSLGINNDVGVTLYKHGIISRNIDVRFEE